MFNQKEEEEEEEERKEEKNGRQQTGNESGKQTCFQPANTRARANEDTHTTYVQTDKHAHRETYVVVVAGE